MIENNEKKAKKIIEFVDKHFPQAEAHARGVRLEFRFRCPFCYGGQSNEVSFDLNPYTGACRCWRATCDWRGTVEWFICNYLDVSYERACEITTGDKPSSLEELHADLKILDQSLRRPSSYTSGADGREPIDAWVRASQGLSETHRLYEPIHNWLHGQRGYEPEHFLEQHSVWVPPQIGRYEGRVLFEVRSEDDRAYLAYAFDPTLDKKTLNPSGKILSKMLYNYNEVKSGRVLFVCEGIFDSARLYSYGFFATSLFGVNISPRQVRLLADTEAEEICICLDHGTLKKAKDIATKVSDFAPDKRVTILNINEKHWASEHIKFKKGMDPDDLSEEQFLKYYSHRIRKNSTQEDFLKAKLKKMSKCRNI